MIIELPPSLVICQLSQPFIQLNGEGAEEDLMYLNIQILVQPLFLRQTLIHVFLHCELVNLPIQPLFNLFLGQISMMRHHEYFSSRSQSSQWNHLLAQGVLTQVQSQLCQPTKPYTTGPFHNNLRSAGYSLTRSSMVRCKNQFFASRDQCDVFQHLRFSFTQIDKLLGLATVLC